MAPIGHSIVPLRFRDSFFRDPYFSDSWDTMERQRRQFERDCEEASQRVFGRSSSPFGSSALDHRQHDSLADYFKSTSGVNSRSLLSGNSGLTSNSETDFKTEKDHYKVILDVQQFKPEELCVKTSDDNNTIIIEGKHEEKSEGSSSSGYISRQFTRKYTLPADVKLDSLQCNLSADGVLQLTAPRTMKSITDGSTSTTAATTSEKNNLASTANTSNNGYTSNYSSKQESSERMTVDGRKIDSGLESADSKYDNYAKWKESRGEEPEIFKTGYDNVDNANFGSTSKTTSSTTATSSRLGTSSLNDTAGSKFRDIDDFHLDNSRFLSSRMRNRDPFLHILPDFDMEPFWKRRSGTELSKYFVDEARLGVQNDTDNFKVLVDVKQFKPEELSVRCTDQFVIVEGKHEEKEDSYGYISRHFTRKYDLPKGIRGDDVQCNLNASGILEIKAPYPKPKAVEFEQVGRKVPISMSDNAQRAQSKYVSSESIRKEQASSSGKDVGYNVLPIQREQTRQESVESTMSSSTVGGTNNNVATGSSNAANRHVTIEELSRSSSSNSNFNDSLLNRHHNINSVGEHVIPITIAAK